MNSRRCLCNYQHCCLNFQVTLSTSDVPVNPSEDHPPSKAPALSVPSDSFSLANANNGHRSKTYSLLIKVYSSGSSNGLANNDYNSDSQTDENLGEEGANLEKELVVFFFLF